jgi:hypothetical protein
VFRALMVTAESLATEAFDLSGGLQTALVAGLLD